MSTKVLLTFVLLALASSVLARHHRHHHRRHFARIVPSEADDHSMIIECAKSAGIASVVPLPAYEALIKNKAHVAGYQFTLVKCQQAKMYGVARAVQMYKQINGAVAELVGSIVEKKVFSELKADSDVSTLGCPVAYLTSSFTPFADSSNQKDIDDLISRGKTKSCANCAFPQFELNAGMRAIDDKISKLDVDIAAAKTKFWQSIKDIAQEQYSRFSCWDVKGDFNPATAKYLWSHGVELASFLQALGVSNPAEFSVKFYQHVQAITAPINGEVKGVFFLPQNDEFPSSMTSAQVCEAISNPTLGVATKFQSRVCENWSDALHGYLSEGCGFKNWSKKDMTCNMNDKKWGRAKARAVSSNTDSVFRKYFQAYGAYAAAVIRDKVFTAPDHEACKKIAAVKGPFTWYDKFYKSLKPGAKVEPNTVAQEKVKVTDCSALAIPVNPSDYSKSLCKFSYVVKEGTAFKFNDAGIDGVGI